MKAAPHASTCAYVAPLMVSQLRQDDQIYVGGLRNHFALILFLAIHLEVHQVAIFSNGN